MNKLQKGLAEAAAPKINKPLPTVRYCLYARKSTETEERQTLSIDSQIKEMKAIAERDKLHIAAVRSEAHSAKDSGGREIFNKMLGEIKLGKYNAILTWAPDRLSRNAGDLGRLVDLMDSHVLLEIRTYNQQFTNSPNEKFLLMILGSQAKLENDNKSLNVKRGLRTRCEMGLWPAPAPTGYLTDIRRDRKGYVRVDKSRAYIIKLMYEKATQGSTSREIRRWLREELDFRSVNNKHMSLSMVQRILSNTFYYGEFKYPEKDGIWYKGIHQPIITKELYDAVRQTIDKRKRSTKRIFRKNFAYTKLMKCSLCGSTIIGEEKFKMLKDGSLAKYVYYGCSRTRDPYCKLRYTRENDLIEQLRNLVDKLSIDDLGVRGQMDLEVDRFFKFHRDVVGDHGNYDNIEQRDLDTKKYLKYLLMEGTIEEKRHVLLNLKSRLIIKDKRVYLDTVPEDDEETAQIINF